MFIYDIIFYDFAYNNKKDRGVQMEKQSKKALVQSLKEAIANNDMDKLNTLADMINSNSTTEQNVPIYEGIIPEGMKLPQIRTVFVTNCRKAILEGDAQLVGDLVAGLRDITMENVTDAAIFQNMFQRKQIAKLKKGKSSDGFWRGVGECILNSEAARKFPAWACRVLYLYAGQEGYEALQSVSFWRFGKLLRKSIESQDERLLAKLLLTLDKNTDGRLYECDLDAITYFFSMDEEYEADILQILKDLGVNNAADLDGNELWEQMNPEKQCLALSRFILSNKKFWKNISGYLLSYCKDHGGYGLISTCLSEVA